MAKQKKVQITEEEKIEIQVQKYALQLKDMSPESMESLRIFFDLNAPIAARIWTAMQEMNEKNEEN